MRKPQLAANIHSARQAQTGGLLQLGVLFCFVGAPFIAARSQHFEPHSEKGSSGQQRQHHKSLLSDHTPRSHDGIVPDQKPFVESKASRKSHNLQKQQAGASMPLWLPSWWAADLDNFQEFPVPPSNTSEQYFGQDEEDRHVVEHYFAGKQHGTYLEMGGYNGLTFTNTLHLHRAYAWRGMLIEPSPEMFWQMVGNRPEDICIHSAACNDFRRVHFVDSGVTSGIFEVMSESFRELWHKGVEKDSLPMIPCMPLASMLAKFSIHHIDFWSLDVEGAELAVLQTFDFDAVNINVVCIEADGHDPAKDKAVKDLMVEHGYIHDGKVFRNDWFHHASFVPASLHGASRS